MSVLLWIAALIGTWCAASLVAALVLGTYLRRRSVATDPEVALRPLDTGPLRLWLGEFPPVPDTPATLTAEAGGPSPRPTRESADQDAAAVR